MSAGPAAAVIALCPACNRPSWLAVGSLTCDACMAADLAAVDLDGDASAQVQPECPACGKWTQLQPESGVCRSCDALGLDYMSPRSWSASGGYGRGKLDAKWPTTRAKRARARQRRRKAERNTQTPRADRPTTRRSTTS